MSRRSAGGGGGGGGARVVPALAFLEAAAGVAAGLEGAVRVVWGDAAVAGRGACGEGKGYVS